MKNGIHNPFLYYLPSIGIAGFFILFFVATQYYPGGSYYDRSADSFSWTHNYWCNLMDKRALNGELNPARTLAITATFFLCAGMAAFYYIFPRYFVMRKFWKIFVQVVGIGSMLFAVLLFTKHHDFVLNIAGTLGGLALIGTLVALEHSLQYRMLWIGRFCFLLIMLNSYIYYTRVFVDFLPVLQKITLLLVLPWMMALNLLFMKKNLANYSDNQLHGN